MSMEEREALGLNEALGQLADIIQGVKRLVSDAESTVEQSAAAVPTLRGLAEEAERLAAQVAGLQMRSQISETIIDAQEQERHRLARELHDGPAQALANIVLRAEICQKLLAEGRPEVEQELDQMKILVRESLRELRKIIFDLRPMTLDALGLVPTLKRYFENTQQYGGPPVYLHTEGSPQRLPSAIEVAAFRTIQEAVNNARRHAQASRIDVTLRFMPDSLQVTVVDDGIGFEVDEVWRELKDRASFGLIGMHERIELLSGEFSIESAVEKGSTVRFCLPTSSASPLNT